MKIIMCHYNHTDYNMWKTRFVSMVLSIPKKVTHTEIEPSSAFEKRDKLGFLRTGSRHFSKIFGFMF